MTGVFRYGKSIAASLLLSAIALLASYGPHWVFPHVDPLPRQGQGTIVDSPLFSRRAAPPVRQESKQTTVWKVAVVTNRPNGEEVTTTKPFQATKSLSEQVVDAIYNTADTHHQFCEVTLPHSRRRGTCAVDDGAQAGIRLAFDAESEARTFYSQLEQLTQQSNSQDVLVFVHGFNVNLKNAVARAAQVAEDMPFAGTVVVFSWNSQAETLAYRQDEHTAERHFWSLAELLHGLQQQLGTSRRIHIVAHSMGNRVTLRAINALAGTIDPVGQPTDMFVAARLQAAENVQDAFPDADSLRAGILSGSDEIPQRFPIWASWRKQQVSAPPLANLILAAPDVGAGEFSRLVRDVRHLCGAVTVYASDSDVTLEASRRIHGGEFRAGDARATLNVAGVHVIRVSAPGLNDPLGHSYYGSHPTVLDQLHQLMRPVQQVSLGSPIGLQ